MSRMNESDEDLMTRFQMQGGQSSTHATTTNASRPPSRAAYGDPNTEAITRVARETEAKCSKLLADAESRILDERNKYQQKEFAMKEDLLKEKSKTNDATQKKVKDVLDMYRKEAEKSATLSTQHHQTVVTNIQSESRARTDDLAEKVRALERQLADRERELETMERRNAEEKKELLALRTGQLRLESSRKGGEGEMVNRAMATIAEYEAAVRKSEAENATRLAEYVDGFTHDWLARAKEFEEHKGRFEAETLEKAFQILRDQESTLAEKEEKMRLRMVDVLTQQSEARMDQEAKLLEQFEKFKMEYKSLQDRDFEARCGMYDRSLEQREMLLFDRLNVERQKVAEAQQRHSEAAEMQRVQALNEAMAQVTVMREQLLADNHRKQEEVHAGLLAQRDIMHQEMVEGERLKTEQMAAMQQKIIDATSEAHRVVEEVKRQSAESEAAVHEKYIEVMNQRNRELEVETAAFKEALERNYFSKLNELTTAQSVEVKRLTDEFLEKQHTESSEAFKREQEMRMAYDAKTAKFEEETQKRYKKQLSDAAEAETVLKEQIQTMRKEVADLQAGLAHAQQAAKTREMQLEGKLAKAQRDIGAAKLEAEDTLRAKYEKWLEEAMAGSHKNTVDRLEYERMKRDAESVEARCQETVRREREQLHAAREESRAACDRRIAEERNRLERLEADMLERVADMRVELEADLKRREAANQRLFDAERRSLHDEAGERSAEERRERQAFEDRVKDQEEARWRAINKDLQLSCEERVKTSEIRITERESELNQREAAFRQEKLAHQQKLVSDKQRAEAEEWELRSKLELTIRKEADARLQSERERLQTELDGIRKHAVEQQRAMEEARQQLQRQMEEDRAQAEQEVQARFETLHEQSLKEAREAQKARDAAAAEKEAALREKHARALAQADEAHKKECEGLQARLDALRGDVDAERLAYQQEMKEAFRTREEAIRAETQARIKAEQEALRQKELQMSHDNDRLRLEMEARAREDTQRLFDIRSRSLEETDEERKKAESEFFTRMKAKIEEGDAQARERQKRLEEQMRTFTDKALAEQQRQMSATSSAEAERLQEECTRLRGELAKRRQADQAELSGAVDERVGEYRRQLDREREQERMLAEGLRDRQAAEAQKRAEARVAETTASYEAQLEKLRDALGQEKLQAQKAILAKDEEANVKLEEASRLLQEKMNTLLTDLKQMYESKWRQMQEHDLEKAASLDRQKMEYEEKVKANYEKLLKDAERQYHEQLTERERARVQGDKEKDRALQQLTQDMDLLKVQQMDEIERQVKARAAELTAQLEQDKQEYLGVVDAERERREVAERNVTTLQQELDKITYSMNQWKLELHKSLVSKYENLFNEVQARSRKDREAFARKLLEEEEKRLARELVRKDNDLARSRAEIDQAASRETEEREHRTQTAEMQIRIKRLFEAFGSRREKLLKLWDLIDTDPAERMQLLNGVFAKLGLLSGVAALSASPEVSPRRSELDLNAHMLQVVNSVYEELCGEIARLEAQLPLMDIITRREFVKHRLSEVFAAPAGAMRDKQVTDLKRELQILDEQLLSDLPRYEQAHNAKLFYKNQRYLLVMEKDLQDPILAMQSAGYPAVAGRYVAPP